MVARLPPPGLYDPTHSSSSAVLRLCGRVPRRSASCIKGKVEEGSGHFAASSPYQCTATVTLSFQCLELPTADQPHLTDKQIRSPTVETPNYAAWYPSLWSRRAHFFAQVAGGKGNYHLDLVLGLDFVPTSLWKFKFFGEDRLPP